VGEKEMDAHLLERGPEKTSVPHVRLTAQGGEDRQEGGEKPRQKCPSEGGGSMKNPLSVGEKGENPLVGGAQATRSGPKEKKKKK